MIKELSNRYIYDDFINRTILTEDERKVLDRLIRKETIVKISTECGICERSVSDIIHVLKDKYSCYKQLEVAKLKVFEA
jgi:hypothetical protein